VLLATLQVWSVLQVAWLTGRNWWEACSDANRIGPAVLLKQMTAEVFVPQG